MTIRRALVLSLGEFDEKAFPPGEQAVVVKKLREVYRHDPDPGLHGAAEWLLRHWKQDQWLKQMNEEWAKDKPQREQRRERIKQELAREKGAAKPQWYVNGQGQTLVAIPGPVEFWMGSPEQESGRDALIGEPKHRKRIGRSFALATKEVTVEQFLRFRPNHDYMKQRSPKPDGPMIRVSWYDAAAYCNWLSQQEGIPESEWCYPKNVGPGMMLPPTYLSRTGYRLPTEAEWEYACRAEAVTSRFYGAADDLLKEYAWYAKTTNSESVRPGGLLRPNDFGLFDMLGGVWEWCQERALPYSWPAGQQEIEDKEDMLDIIDTQERLLRGGAYYTPALDLRSANRYTVRPSRNHDGAGLRVARTYH